MDIKIFFNFFLKYAYKKYICTILLLLFLKYGLACYFFDKQLIFSTIFALLIYDLPFYLNFKHWENNKVVRYRDLLEIFTSIISILHSSYNNSTQIVNVGYFAFKEFKDKTSVLMSLAQQRRFVDFNLAKLCSKDFQALQYIHSQFFETYCCDEKMKEDFLLLTGNITKMERDIELILSLANQSQQLDCVDNFHLQVMNICSEMNDFYADFFNEVESNIPITKARYLNEVIGGR